MRKEIMSSVFNMFYSGEQKTCIGGKKKKKEENNKRVENWVNQSGWRRKVMRKKQCPAQEPAAVRPGF